MKTLIVIPVRGTAPSKTRLTPLFNDQQRMLLIHAMVQHMIRQMPVDVDVAVITRSPETLADVLPDATVLQQDSRYPGLNGSLEQAIRFARDQNYAELLMLPGDLPMLQAAEVTSILLEEGRMVIVGDRDQEGTNGLRLPVAWADTFAFGMGEHSFTHHIAEAHRHGVVPVTVYHRGLAHDLDTPDDWYALSDESRERLNESLQWLQKERECPQIQATTPS